MVSFYIGTFNTGYQALCIPPALIGDSCEDFPEPLEAVY